MAKPQPRVCGGSLNTGSAVVSADGYFIFVSSGATVRMYSSLTGDRVLELHGHAAEVTAICVDPANTQQVPLLVHCMLLFLGGLDAHGTCSGLDLQTVPCSSAHSHRTL